MRAQLDTMERQVPLLYLILLICVWSLGIQMYGKAPIQATMMFPAGLTGIIAYRLYAWVNRERGQIAIHLVVRKLRILVGVAFLVTVLTCGWAAVLTNYSTGVDLAWIASFSVMTLLTTVFALAPLGVAAMVAIIIGACTMMATSLFLSNETLLSISASFCLVLMVIVALLGRLNRSFTSEVHARVELEQMNQQAQALNDQLQEHKGHLEELVKNRTQQLEEQTLKLQQALAGERELNEMQNQFVTMVSHEFRTPMAIIDGTARRVIKHADDMEGEEIIERMLSVRGAIARLSGLVERTLDASKLASGKIAYAPERCDPKSLLEDVIDRHREYAKGFTFNVDLDGLCTEIIADARHVDHIFTNLISNAIKYSKQSPVIDISGHTEGGLVRVTVRDHGVGIPKAELPRITERFFRATTSQGIQGTGIGLNLVNELVGLHGGTMTLDSEVGKWTEVTVCLPVCPPMTAIVDNAAAGEDVSSLSAGSAG